MAIFHFSTKIISRAKGQSAVACAAYRAGDKIYDERYDRLQDYTKKEDVVYSEILLPDNLPAWMKEREKLWNHIEKIETRKDSRLAREFEIALPRELTDEQNLLLIKKFAYEKFISQGLIVDLAIHDGMASDGNKQPHAHLMLIERKVDQEGFGKKYREFNKEEALLSLRKDFCNLENKHLALNGHDIQVDHRSLKAQGIDLIPQKKIGPTGSFHQMAAYEEQLQNTRTNGERLLANPEIVLDVITHQQSTFTHRDIARIVNRYTVDGEQFLAVYEKVKVSAALVALGKDDKGQERFTTKGMLQLESEMMGTAKLLDDKQGHSVAETSIEMVAKKHDLSPEQSNVLTYLVAEGDLKNVIGYAGTGKSRMLAAAREIWESSGYRVLGATLSGIAAENLAGSSGIESRTLASRCYYWERGEELLSAKDILVIDEAGMIGSRQMAEIVYEANLRDAKVIMMGDPEQLQAIQAGAAFRAITEQSSYMALTDIRRQQVDWQKEATIQLATQQTAAAILQYAAHDHVHEFATEQQARGALVDAWNDARIAQSNQSHMMLAYTRDAVLDLNESARHLRQSLGELGQDYAIKTERGERKFAEGDRISFLKNDRDLGVKNGTLGIILNIDQHSITVNLDKQDRDKTHAIQFSTDQYNHIDYGYAATIHKSQGVTVDRSYVLASRYLDRHASYVAMTRHRDSAEIFWSKEEFPSYDVMVHQLGRERAKDVSLDYLDHEFEKAAFASYRGLDTLWDNFWEKYGAVWLEKIQQTLSVWGESIKDYVEAVQEKLANTLSMKHEKIPSELLSTEEIWLKEMRALVDASNVTKAPNNEEAKKDTNIQPHHEVERTELNDRDAHYAALYQQLKQETKVLENKKIVDKLKQYQGSLDVEPSKALVKELDKEMEF